MDVENPVVEVGTDNGAVECGAVRMVVRLK